ncbi:MAG: RDD family protein [Candidatus Eremiobacterota bacterium]
MNDRTMIQTPDGVDLEVHVAGLVSRLGAFLVDGILLVCVWAALAMSFAGIGLWNTASASLLVAILILVMFLTNWGYAVAFELGMRGQTPGKRLAGLRVIREDGLPIGFRESALRNLCRAVDAQPLPTYLVGAVVMSIDPKCRRVGDLVAGTLVVRESLGDARGTRAGAAWAARAERGQAHQAVRLAHGTLTARQVALVEQFLERRASLDSTRRHELARRLAEPLAELLDDAMQAQLRHDPEGVLEGIRALARSQEDPGGSAPVRAAARSGPLF